MQHAPHFASIVIDQNSAPGVISAALIANVPTPIITWGVDGLARGRVDPEFANGRIIVRDAGVYRCEFHMSFRSDDNASTILAQILRNGIATHIGSNKGVNNASSEDTISAADHLELSEDDYISLSLESTAGARIDIYEAQLIVTRM